MHASAEIDTAISQHQAGRLEQAKTLYLQILQNSPQDADALHLLGLVFHQLGEHQAAIDHIQRALALRPEAATFHTNLGAVYQAAEDLENAVASCQRALQINPGDSKAHFNLACAYQALGKLDEAVLSYRSAIQIKPDYLDAHLNLGNTLKDQGELEKAVACFTRAIQIRPNYAQAHNNLGSTLRDLGQLQEAIASYRRALAITPNYAEAHRNLGVALTDEDKLDEAIASYRRALQIDPDHVETHRSLGNALKDQGQIDEAAMSFQRLLELQTDQPLGPLRIARLHPIVFQSSDEVDQYRRQLLSVIESMSNVHLRKQLSELDSWAVPPPFELQFDPQNLRPIKEAYAAIFQDCFPQLEGPSVHAGMPRIGFVVTNKHESVFLRSMAGVLRHLDADAFEAVVFGSPTGMQRIRSELNAPSVRIVSLPRRFDRAVETIRDAACDLLYYWEVGTDKTNYFLPFFRLAPVQCTSWGIQVTSGIPQLDYYLSSELVEPDDGDSHYSETLLLAKTLLTYRYRAILPTSPKARQDFGLKTDQHVYLCAQHLGKFHPDFDRVLAEILLRDTLGALVIPEDRYGHVARRLRDRFAETMADVCDRIVFVPRQARPDYLSLMSVADVLLDPLHFGGVNTTYDGFSVGKPIVTVPGPFHRGRYTYGCYRKMGVTDCVASDLDDYVNIAVRLGTDADYRADIAQKIREASSLLFEDMESVREHERIFQQLVEETRTGCGGEILPTRQVSDQVNGKRQLGPVFLGGAGRSGTTLVRVMLDSHPNVCCGPEFKVLPIIAHLYQKLMGPFESVMQAYGNTREDVIRHLRQFVEGLMENFRHASGKTRWAEKTPHNVLNMVALGEIFPDARFVHVVRDGRDVASSLVTMDWVDPITRRKVEYIQNIRNAARYWRRTVEAAREQAADPSLAGRVLEVRYEALVTETEETLRQVFQFIGEPWDDVVLSHHMTSRADEPPESSTRQVRKPLYRSSIGRWKTQMTDQDRADFMAEAGVLLEQLGYTWDEQETGREFRYGREAALLQHYDSNVEYYSPLKPQAIGAIIGALEVDLHHVKRALDLGCGDGRLSIWLANTLGIQVDGVDFSPKRIAKAKRAARTESLNCTFVCEDLNLFLDRCDQKYGLIALFEVLEHLEQPEEVLAAALRLLDGHGAVIGSVPLNMPYVAHLQVFKDLAEVKARLKPDAVYCDTRHAFCRWNAESNRK